MTDAVKRLNEAMFDIKDKTRIDADLWNPLALAICDVTDEVKRLREALSMIVEGDAEIVKLEGGVSLLKAGPWGLIARAALGDLK